MMSQDTVKAHSHLGPSSAERWMNCPGSTRLIKTRELPVTDDPDYQRNGTTAHAAAARCLEQGMDAWEVVGEEIEGIVVSGDMGLAIQTYLDVCRAKMGAGRDYQIETRVQLPEREDAFGTGDFASFDEALCHLDIVDYKNGHLGVDVEWNPQLLYYAYGFLQTWPGARTVTLTVVQPNSFHEDGPVRSWDVSAEDVCEWVNNTLLPAMDSDREDLVVGDWCRFCPAKIGCPALSGAFGAMIRADIRTIVKTGAATLGQEYQAFAGVKHYMKAVEEQLKTWLNRGKTVPGAKLVRSKTNRVWKEGAQQVLEARFGAAAFSEPELKSPAQIEKLNSTGKDVAVQWSFSPQGAVSLALETDKRPAVKIQSAAETFAGALDIPEAAE